MGLTFWLSSPSKSSRKSSCLSDLVVRGAVFGHANPSGTLQSAFIAWTSAGEKVAWLCWNPHVRMKKAKTRKEPTSFYKSFCNPVFQHWHERQNLHSVEVSLLKVSVAFFQQQNAYRLRNGIVSFDSFDSGTVSYLFDRSFENLNFLSRSPLKNFKIDD